MKTAGRFVAVGWLLLALVLLGMDGQLPVFLAWTAPATLLALTVGALVRQQRAPHRCSTDHSCRALRVRRRRPATALRCGRRSGSRSHRRVAVAI
jgi:hypothetical protein